jgi:hypothetical protein
MEPPDPAVIRQWITDIVTRWGSGDVLLRLPDGRPVVFVYRADLLSAAQWKDINAALSAAGIKVALIGSDMAVDVLNELDGYFTWNSLVYSNLTAAYQQRGELTQTDHLLFPTEARKIWVATATPGMNHTHNPFVPPRYYDREDGMRYINQWQAGTDSRADWRLIATWNDFGEETAIAPSTAWGTTYTDLTRQLTAH